MTPKDVLVQFEKAYLECGTYSDVGEVTEFHQGQDDPIAPFMTFKTVFQRPSKLRFEWTKSEYPRKGSSYILVSNGIKTRTQYCFDSGPEEVESLELALGGAVGISRGVTRVIPRLLTVDLYARMYSEFMNNLRFECHEVIGKHECYCIVASSLGKDDTTLWVSMNDFCLRRYRTEYVAKFRSEDHHYSTVISYNQVIMSGTVQDDAFALPL